MPGRCPVVEPPSGVRRAGASRDSPPVALGALDEAAEPERLAHPQATVQSRPDRLKACAPATPRSCPGHASSLEQGFLVQAVLLVSSVLFKCLCCWHG